MIYLLDTNHAYLLMSRPTLPGQKRMDVAYVLCTPVLGELWFMVHNSRRQDGNRRALLSLLRSVDVVDYDVRFVEEFGRLRAALRADGKAVSQVDVQLAAIAKTLHLPILTADRDFDFIHGLTVENWLA